MSSWLRLALIAAVALISATSSAEKKNPLLKNLPSAPKKKSGIPLRLFELSKRDTRDLEPEEPFLPERVYFAQVPGVSGWVPMVTDSRAQLRLPLEVLQPGTVLPSEFLGGAKQGRFLLTPQLKWVPSTSKEVYYLGVLTYPPTKRLVGFRAAVVQPEQVVIPSILRLAKNAKALGPIPEDKKKADCLNFNVSANQWEACGSAGPQSMRMLFKQGKFYLADGYASLRPVPTWVRKNSCLSATYVGGAPTDTIFLRDELTWVWLECWQKAEFEIGTAPARIESWIVEKLTGALASVDYKSK